MVFESFSPAVGVNFSYKAYVGLSMKVDNKESGLSGLTPYGFYHLNSTEASNFLGVCNQCLTFDLSTNQRLIIGRCIEECQKVLNELSIEYWKQKWFEENQRASQIQDQYFKEVGELRSDLLYIEDRLSKAQKKIVHLKKNKV